MDLIDLEDDTIDAEVMDSLAVTMDNFRVRITLVCCVYACVTTCTCACLRLLSNFTYGKTYIVNMYMYVQRYMSPSLYLSRLCLFVGICKPNRSV